MDISQAPKTVWISGSKRIRLQVCLSTSIDLSLPVEELRVRFIACAEDEVEPEDGLGVSWQVVEGIYLTPEQVAALLPVFEAYLQQNRDQDSSLGQDLEKY